MAALHFEMPKAGGGAVAGHRNAGPGEVSGLGLTSLPLESFERMERFYSRHPRSARGALLASSPPWREEAGCHYRCAVAGVLLLHIPRGPRARHAVREGGDRPARLRANYRRKHLMRCGGVAHRGLPAGHGCLCPFPWPAAQCAVADLPVRPHGEAIQRRGLGGRGPGAGSTGREAMDAMERLWRATRTGPAAQPATPGSRDAAPDMVEHHPRHTCAAPQQWHSECQAVRKLKVPGLPAPAPRASSLLAGSKSEDRGNGKCQAQRLCRPEALMLYMSRSLTPHGDDELATSVLSSLKLSTPALGMGPPPWAEPALNRLQGG